MVIPHLSHGNVSIRPIRVRDWRELQHALVANRSWLRKWEATAPDNTPVPDLKTAIRSLIAQTRVGNGLAFIIEVDGVLAGQVNISSIAYGALSSCSIGYWVTQDVAGRGVTPTAVALATDYCFGTLGLHRAEICIRPENAASYRVVQKLGFRYEGLRRRYIHINGDWRDHFCFGLVTEEVPRGVLPRFLAGEVVQSVADISQHDWDTAVRGTDR